MWTLPQIPTPTFMGRRLGKSGGGTRITGRVATRDARISQNYFVEKLLMGMILFNMMNRSNKK